MEEWREIPGWGHRYEVSSIGRVRSKDMPVKAVYGSTAIRKGRLLTLVKKGGRYLCVTLANGELRKQYLIHDLVLLAFVGEKPKGYEALHHDDDRYNNSISNLRYGTRQENEIDRKRNNKIWMGEKHSMAILKDNQVLEIRASTDSYATLSEKYGVCAAHIQAIRSRRAWKHI